jgi:hypothetical protein
VSDFVLSIFLTYMYILFVLLIWDVGNWFGHSVS